MKKWLIWGLIGWLSFGVLACSKGPPYPKTPTAVVEALFIKIKDVKVATKKAKKEGSTEEAAKKLIESKTALDALFLNPKKAKLIMMPLLILDLENVEFIEEKIDGRKAEVTIEQTVVGFALRSKLAESAQKRKRVTFQLKKERGRWMISDINGILARFGR